MLVIAAKPERYEGPTRRNNRRIVSLTSDGWVLYTSQASEDLDHGEHKKVENRQSLRRLKAHRRELFKRRAVG